MIFPDTRSTVLVCFLIYFFRIFERRSGSLKFSSNICLSFLLGFSLDLLFSPLLPADWSPLLSPGPLYLVMPLLTPYYLHVPSKSGPLGPISISSKAFAYLVWLQVALTSPSSRLTGLLSLLVGGAVHCTRLSSVILPAVLGQLSDSLLGWLLSSSPPPPPSSTALMGATLEIQRTQQAEAMEQHLLRARARQFNVVSPPPPLETLPSLNLQFQPVGGRQMRLEELWNQQGNQQAQAMRQPAPPVQPSPVLIQV